MLESHITEQLKDVFSKLDHVVELVYEHSDHEKQSELLELLNAVALTSDKIRLIKSESQLTSPSPIPRFFIRYQGKENGISFSGIPGGHEFTSLIMAILNSDHKGKFPDNQIIKRIQNLKGPIELKTYISLTCENCPEVVQSLNLMAILHSDFKHEMVDGAFVQNEIGSLNIQGVPSVINSKAKEGQLLSAGKVGLTELIKKFEDHFGLNSPLEKAQTDLGVYEVVVIGAGPAGASAAIYSARKGLKTAIIADRIGGQVQDTKGIENFISIPYTEGPQLSAQLAQHMGQYEIKLLEHRKVSEVKNDELTHLKELVLESGEFLKTKAIIVASGAKWRELNIPGEKEYIGRGVAFCPHCDGPSFKGKDVAVIGGGNSGVEAAIDLAGIVKTVTLVEFLPELKADKILVQKLLSLANVSVIKNARTSQVIGNGTKVISLEYEDRTLQSSKSETKTKTENESKKIIQLDGIFVQIGLSPNSGFLKNIVELNKFGEIIIDQKCRTNVPGIYAAGDVTTVPFKQIIIAMGEGAKAALTAFEDQKFSN